MTDKDLIPSSNGVSSERNRVRESAFPAREGELPLESLQARHALEISSAAHRDEAALRGHVTDLLRTDDQSAEERQDYIELMMRRAFLRPKLSFKDTEPYRVHVAHRWVREASVLKTLVAEDELLSDALLGCGNDPWHDGDTGARPRADSYTKLRADVVGMINATDDSHGVPLLPPVVPEEFRDEHGAVLPNYDPKLDEPLVRWMQAFDRVSTYLGIPRGSSENPDCGRWGLYGMLDPDTVRLCFPSPVQILTWEEMLVRESWNHMVHGGRVGVTKALREVYGFHDVEINRIISLARAYGQVVQATDLEADRALICARLEDLAIRCRMGVPDVRAELAALKQLAVVKGMTRSEADDFAKEVTDIVGRIGQETQQLPDRPPRPQLPEG